jgi:perosamine synthetase
MGGWYSAHGHYVPEELGGLSVSRFAEAVTAEGCPISPGANRPLHLHPLFLTCDVYGHGKPTRIANSSRDVRQPEGSLPVTERANSRLFSIPWFKHFRPDEISTYAEAFSKVCARYKDLLPGDQGNPPDVGGWHFLQHSVS